MLKAPLSLIAASLVLAAAPGAAQTADAALVQRVQELEDEKAIREVLVQYGEFLDGRDYAAYSRLFARDGVWTGGFGRFTGPAAIEAMLLENLGSPEPGFVNKNSFHLITTPVVDVQGDTAPHAPDTCSSLHRETGGPPPFWPGGTRMSSCARTVPGRSVAASRMA